MRLRSLAMAHAGVALALLAACASSPASRFYTLSATSPEGTPGAGADTIAVGGVTIPGEIDRPELVRRTGPNQLNISELDRWAAPLDETIRRVRSDDIARRVPARAAGPQHTVFVDIHEFYGDAGCNVTLRAVWTLKQPADQPASAARSAAEEISVPAAGSCPGSLAAAMSKALGQLSDRIVAGVGS